MIQIVTLSNGLKVAAFGSYQHIIFDDDTIIRGSSNISEDVGTVIIDATFQSIKSRTISINVATIVCSKELKKEIQEVVTKYRNKEIDILFTSLAITNTVYNYMFNNFPDVPLYMPVVFDVDMTGVPIAKIDSFFIYNPN